MAQVEISINKRSYQIACDDGQEEHLRELGTYLDHKVEELVSAVGQVGDARLLVMAGLLIADELAEAYTELDEATKSETDGANAARHSARESEGRAAAAIEALAERIEGIAARLEAA
jgi:cell division protein ZapA